MEKRLADELLASRRRSQRNGYIAGAILVFCLLLLNSVFLWESQGVYYFTGVNFLAGYFWYRFPSTWFQTRPRLVLLLRRFRKRSKKEFVLADQLGIACRGLATPVTVQDSSFRGSLPVVLQVLQYFLIVAIFVAPPFIFSSFTAFYPELLNIRSPYLLFCWLAGSGSMYVTAKYLIRRNVVARVTRANWQRTLGDLVRRIRQRPWTYAGTMVLKLPDDRWKNAIDYLLNEADAVVVDVTEITANVEWELHTAYARMPPEAVLLCSALESGNSGEDFEDKISSRIDQIIPIELARRSPKQAYSANPASKSLFEVFSNDYFASSVARCIEARGRMPASRTMRWRSGVIFLLKVTAVLALTLTAYFLLTRIEEIVVADHGLSRNVLSVSVRLTNTLSLNQKAEFWEKVRQQANRLPHTRIAALSDALPLDPESETSVLSDQLKSSQSAPIESSVLHVSPEYFSTVRIQLVRGRGFTASDNGLSYRVAIISVAIARGLFPHEDPVGQRIRLGSSPSIRVRVVGVVNDVKRRRLLRLHELPAVYIPYVQEGLAPSDRMYVLLYEQPNLAELQHALISAVHAIDSEAEVGQITNLRDLYRFD